MDASEPVQKPPLMEKLFEGDPYLRHHEPDLLLRWNKMLKLESAISSAEGGLAEFARSYKNYGIVQMQNGDVEVCEWAPNAVSVSVVGDFNDWNQTSHICTPQDFCKFKLTIAAKADGSSPIPHGSTIKLLIKTHDGQTLWRLSPWTKYAVQRSEVSMDYTAVHWNPVQGYQWCNSRPERPQTLRIYEAHVGISSPESKVATYTYFADSVLPKIQELGYNCVELMAVMEHAYYGSFGYHVTNFFAASSRYGTLDDFKYLVDKAHSYGLYVILDIVHSHAAKNVNDGLNQFDGTDNCFFKGGSEGDHSLWDSKIFDYAKWEVIRFLLSNLSWYIEEYHVDGFRFDGITSMLYHHRGISRGFSGDYKEYFNMEVDIEALVYLMLANKMLHETFPFVVTIAEDVSGMPALCRPVDEGGLGFDYRMSMAVPDLWIKMLKEVKDEDWKINDIWWALTNRRYNEKCVTYAECHDQALVGDKTLAFWLMDAEMYVNMSVHSPRTTVVDRGMALHKLIRLVTMALGGESYLTFIGNEFGHPEWLDFPRKGNDFSYYYARRQMNLPEDKLLRYQFLWAFDQAMQLLDKRFNFMAQGPGFVSRKHEGDKIMAFERGGLLWVFNFHPTKSFPDYKLGVNDAGKYKIALDSDDKKFDGLGRIDPNSEYFTTPEEWDGRAHSLSVYIPSRVALVLYKCAS